MVTHPIEHVSGRFVCRRHGGCLNMGSQGARGGVSHLDNWQLRNVMLLRGCVLRLVDTVSPHDSRDENTE
jgi:hypothetical protein